MNSVVAAIMTFSVAALWLIVFIPTVAGFIGGTLFAAPCLTALSADFVEKLPNSRANAD